jgi:hypothetical protein
MKVGAPAGPAKVGPNLRCTTLGFPLARETGRKIDCRISAARETRDVELEGLALQSFIRSAALRPR